MDLSELIVGASGLVWDQKASNALVAGLVSATVVSGIFMALGLVTALRLENPRAGIFLQAPLMVVGLGLGIAGLVMLTLKMPYVVSVPLAAGGGLAFVESLVNMLIVVLAWQQKQALKKKSLAGEPPR